jgi:hypothetical protein
MADGGVTRARSTTMAADGQPFAVPDDFADWERTQIKTFAKWANLYLEKRGMRINDFGMDLQNGYVHVSATEVLILFDEPLLGCAHGKYCGLTEAAACVSLLWISCSASCIR